LNMENSRANRTCCESIQDFFTSSKFLIYLGHALSTWVSKPIALHWILFGMLASCLSGSYVCLTVNRLRN
uniref:Uncharacterized protein n=1 Tax=Hippocampus comes TaxID=109280 RepID=A0A3Q2YIH1_HIPCM